MTSTRHHTFTVPDGQAPERADRVLARQFKEYSRSALQRAFDAGAVLLDGEPIDRDEKVAGGDELVFSLPEVRPSELRPVALPLSILYEDAHFLAIDKAPGMVVHPGAGTGENTLVHALLHHCRGQLSGVGGVERPGIVHRLDKETSGVLVAAKTDAAHAGLSRQFVRRTLQKEYLALVRGCPRLLSGRIDQPVGRHTGNRIKMTVTPTGRGAVTDWEIVEAAGDRAALIRCRIHTGRTHQIRVHLAWLGHPLLGDSLYGDRRRPNDPVIPRIMLHAVTLELSHPVSGEEMRIEAPMPEDFGIAFEQIQMTKPE